jgi:hypothetical protein
VATTPPIEIGGQHVTNQGESGSSGYVIKNEPRARVAQ